LCRSKKLGIDADRMYLPRNTDADNGASRMICARVGTGKPESNEVVSKNENWGGGVSGMRVASRQPSQGVR